METHFAKLHSGRESVKKKQFVNILTTRVSAAFGRQNPSWIVEW